MPIRIPTPPLVGIDQRLRTDAALVGDLSRLVGAENVSADAEERRKASLDMWPKAFLWERQGRAPTPPDAVVRPTTIEEIAAVVRYAAERGIPITPHGAGSGVCGGAIPVKGGVTLRFEGMNRVLRIDRERLIVDAQVGVLGTDLEEALRAKGLTLGHFPSSIGCSTLGGWLAARSAGQSSSRYGKIEDMVQAVSCVLGTGAIVRPRRPASGVDWIELLLGSEGTLGIFADARLRLWPAPQVQLPRGWRFRSLGAGIAAMEAIFRAGIRPSVLRLYDPIDTVIALGGRHPDDEAAEVRPPPGIGSLRPAFGKNTNHAVQRFLLDLGLSRTGLLNQAASLARASLLVAVHEGAFGEAEPEAAEVRAICRAHGGKDLGEGPGRRWLRERYSVSYKLPKVFESGAWVDTFEVATSWGRVESLFLAIRAAVAPHALVMAHFSHAYADGCSIYFTFTGKAAETAEGIASYDRAWSAALDAAYQAGATITHHHGVGLFKSPWLRDELGEGGMSLLHSLKRSCDPAGVLNPGKLGLDGADGDGHAAPVEVRQPNGEDAAEKGFLHKVTRLPFVKGEAAVDSLDVDAMWIRAFAAAPVAEVEARLGAAGLTLGPQPPSVMRGTVAQWLEGPFAGRRVEGGRLGPGVASLEVALPNGFLFVSRPTPRSAAGPGVAQLFLGGGGRFGTLVAATLKAMPIPTTREFGLRGPAAAIGRLLIQLAQEATPPLDVRVVGGDPLEASITFVAGSEREEARLGRALAAARALGLETIAAEPRFLDSQDWERELACAHWNSALEALPPGKRLRLTRIARESAVAVGDREAGRPLSELPSGMDDPASAALI